MALTPESALAVSPAAILTPEELADADRFEKEFDAHLRGDVPENSGPRSLDEKPRGWNGTMAEIDLPARVSSRLMGELVRRYTRAGWNVQIHELPSQTRGPRGEVVVGALRVVFLPVWERVKTVSP